MSSPSYLRLGGIGLLVGCLITIVAQVLTFVVPGPQGLQGPPAAWVAWLGLLAGIVTLFGVPALYGVQPKRLGLLGLLGMIGFCIAIVIYEVILNILAATTFGSTAPAGGAFQPPVWLLVLFIGGGVLLLLGSVLFGIAILRSKVFPVWSGWALIVLGVFNGITSFLPPTPAILAIASTVLTIVQLLVLAWMGYWIMSRMANSAVQAEA